MSIVSRPAFPLHYLADDRCEHLELLDVGARDLTPTPRVPRDLAGLLRDSVALETARRGDDDPDDDGPHPSGGAIDFAAMYDDELIAICDDESAGVELLSGASLELLRRLDRRRCAA